MSSMNANALFIGANSSSSYHQAIQLPDVTKIALRNADKKIRGVLRHASENIVKFGRQMNFATDAYRLANQAPLTLELKFLLQGGFAYDTAIEPAYMPPQQSDRDTGVYVKTSFVSKDEPGLASKKLFDLVEDALKDLCEREGWTLVKKDTCVRIQLSARMHIDLPLYAIPDEEFVTLQNSIQDATGLAFGVASERMLKIMDGYKTLRIPTDRVMLAHRQEGWVHSDPRALHDWFDEQFRRYGPQVRRQSRYFKGWRDNEFQKGGPSSVALMVCVANCYREGFVTADEARDDLAFHQIAKRLPEMMSGDIMNPVLDVPSAMNAWGDIEREQYLSAANDLEGTVHKALHGHYLQSLTVQRLQKALGTRIPNRPDLVKAHSRAPEIGVPATVAASSPLPARGRTTSG